MDDWLNAARCKGQADLFFPDTGEKAVQAKAICADCPVSSQCLDFALRYPEALGIWGGTTEKERRGMRSARERAPRVECANGHPFDAANTFIDATGRRKCRACHREGQRRARDRRRAMT